MARKRYITSDISIDEAVAAVAVENPTSALMWPWFIKELDDWGRMTGSALKIKLQVFQAFPFTVDDIQLAIDLYAKHSLIYAYEAKGTRYLAVDPETFYKHQPYIHTNKRVEDKSSIPAPVDAPWNDTSRSLAESRGESREIVPSPSPSPSPSEETIYSPTGNHADEEPPYREIIDYLNEQARTSFRTTNNAAKRHINARWSQGYRLDDFKSVIDVKTGEWIGTEWEKYLRPSTLFGTKFEDYLSQKTRAPTGKLITDQRRKEIELIKELYHT